ncbi:MAG: fibrillarin-like rRNA/tRNA 2'-O-methyltransferase, partial [Candidatus Methanomethyliaceae archaeon]|nr:fibrillarin-like rRNA/tRNA 2'-O-methyltransferase [Candidatus Methanomethyliaceae archaeon]
MINIKSHPKFSNVYIVEDEEAERLATKNLVPGIKVYGEQLYKFKGEEYRAWDPFRSKLSASIEKGIIDIPINQGTHILYLGAA